jgi:hypothetical protein
MARKTAAQTPADRVVPAAAVTARAAVLAVAGLLAKVTTAALVRYLLDGPAAAAALRQSARPDRLRVMAALAPPIQLPGQRRVKIRAERIIWLAVAAAGLKVLRAAPAV